MKYPVLLPFIFILVLPLFAVFSRMKTTVASGEYSAETVQNNELKTEGDYVKENKEMHKHGEAVGVEMEVVFAEEGANNTSEEISSVENNYAPKENTLDAAETEVPGETAEATDAEKEIAYEDDFEEDEEYLQIKDSIEPFNRAMFVFNDKFYYYLFKPVYKGYSFVMPEPARKSVRNFYTNLQMPGRFFNCLFQGKGKGAGTELLRFTINSTLGIGGLFDVAKAGFDLKGYEEDVGQTLAKANMGEGTYIVLPFFGPSNVRDTVGLAGDTVLNPITWVTYFFLAPIEGFGINAYNVTNTGSLEAEETYEKITKPAIDPYIALQDAYTKNRNKKIRE